MPPAPVRSGAAIVSSAEISVNALLTVLKALQTLQSGLEHARTWNVYLFRLMPAVVILPTARLTVVAGPVEVNPAWDGSPLAPLQVMRLVLVLTVPWTS